jgi:hypothetical protein
MASTRARWHGAFKRCQPSPHSQRTDTRALSVVIACPFFVLSLSPFLPSLYSFIAGAKPLSNPSRARARSYWGSIPQQSQRLSWFWNEDMWGTHTHTHTHGSGSATRFVVNVAVHECNISHSGNSGFKDLLLSLQEPAQFDGSRPRSRPSDGGRTHAGVIGKICISLSSSIMCFCPDFALAAGYLHPLSILLLLQPREVSSLLVGCHPWCTNAAFLRASTPDNSSRFVV